MGWKNWLKFLLTLFCIVYLLTYFIISFLSGGNLIINEQIDKFLIPIFNIYFIFAILIIFLVLIIFFIFKNNWKAWLKGGLALIGLYLFIINLVMLVSVNLPFGRLLGYILVLLGYIIHIPPMIVLGWLIPIGKLTGPAHLFGFPSLSEILISLLSIAIFYFIIGALIGWFIGWLYGKLKSKNLPQ